MHGSMNIKWEYSILKDDVLLSPDMKIIQGCTNPRCQVTKGLCFLQWHLIFVDPQYGTSFVSPFWSLQFWGGFKILGKYVHPWNKPPNSEMYFHPFHVTLNVPEICIWNIAEINNYGSCMHVYLCDYVFG